MQGCGSLEVVRSTSNRCSLRGHWKDILLILADRFCRTYCNPNIHLLRTRFDKRGRPSARVSDDLSIQLDIHTFEVSLVAYFGAPCTSRGKLKCKSLERSDHCRLDIP